MKSILLAIFCLSLTGCITANPETLILKRVNDGVNQSIFYMSDTVTSGEEDYWQSPRETMRRGEGDCEDYAILKAYELRQLGYDKPLDILVLKNNTKDEYHAVLMADSHFILDNIEYSVVSFEYLKTNYTLNRTINVDELFYQKKW